MKRDPTPHLPTAHDVARLAGVSQSAVSRAFTEGASISPAMRDRIVVAAKELGYRPNILARSLIQRKSQVVGVVLGNIENPFFSLVLDKLSNALAEVGCRALLFNASPNAHVDEQVDELLRYRVRALVLLAVNLSSELAAECARAKIPLILFNRIALDAPSAFSVVGDNALGAEAIARHFLSSGRRDLAFMAGYEQSSTSNTRGAAFADAVERAGMATPRHVTGHYSRSGAIEAARELFRDPRGRPDAIFCANDLMAIATIEIARSEFGLEAGRDYAIAGFDDIPMASWQSFSLTTYSQPVDAMVRHAVGFVTAPEDVPFDQRSIVVPGELILRKSA